jgi:hypothetical protein
MRLEEWLERFSHVMRQKPLSGSRHFWGRRLMSH